MWRDARFLLPFGLPQDVQALTVPETGVCVPVLLWKPTICLAVLPEVRFPVEGAPVVALVTGAAEVAAHAGNRVARPGAGP